MRFFTILALGLALLITGINGQAPGLDQNQNSNAENETPKSFLIAPKPKLIETAPEPPQVQSPHNAI
jgi:PBP1b-binding outer membrane lipoprotein LpoB